eukprot:10767899-Alexandrium_andersonii.AAC.1
MMCYDRASEIQFLLKHGRLERNDAKVLSDIHSDVFDLNFRGSEGELPTPIRKKRRVLLRRVMPFKHGAVDGVLEEIAFDSVVVVRSCSWSCHHCVLERFEREFQASLRRLNVPDNDYSALAQLSLTHQLPPWYSGDRLAVVRGLRIDPYGTPTDRLRAMQELSLIHISEPTRLALI